MLCFSPPIARIRAGISCSECLTSISPRCPYPFLRDTVSLLPFISTRSLPRSDQHMISRFSGLAAQAVSVALECGETPYEALRLLESGRVIL